jgi:hypothetical protein
VTQGPEEETGVDDDLWLERCVVRMKVLAPDIDLDEAQRLAREMLEIERFRAMSPEWVAEILIESRDP